MTREELIERLRRAGYPKSIRENIADSILSLLEAETKSLREKCIAFAVKQCDYVLFHPTMNYSTNRTLRYVRDRIKDKMLLAAALDGK
jgi:broad-specificity NMP kinase